MLDRPPLFPTLCPLPPPDVAILLSSWSIKRFIDKTSLIASVCPPDSSNYRLICKGSIIPSKLRFDNREREREREREVILILYREAKFWLHYGSTRGITKPVKMTTVSRRNENFHDRLKSLKKKRKKEEERKKERKRKKK